MNATEKGFGRLVCWCLESYNKISTSLVGNSLLSVMQGFKRFCWGNIVVGSLEWLNADEDFKINYDSEQSPKKKPLWCVPILEHLKCIYEEC